MFIWFNSTVANKYEASELFMWNWMLARYTSCKHQHGGAVMSQTVRLSVKNYVVHSWLRLHSDLCWSILWREEKTMKELLILDKRGEHDMQTGCTFDKLWWHLFRTLLLLHLLFQERSCLRSLNQLSYVTVHIFTRVWDGKLVVPGKKNWRETKWV